MKKMQSGFTLIEIAIVLVIIGLLLGGVLKGQEMMNNAKLKRATNDYNGVAAAIYSYLDRYGALPGDDPNANARWGSTAPTNGTLGDGVIAGACDSIVATDESAAVFEHLRQSGLISGSGYTKPANAFGGILCVEDAVVGTTTTTNIASGPIICINGVEGAFGEILDIQLDDGVGDAGDVQNFEDTGGGGAATVDPYVLTDVYYMCKQI